MRIGNACILFLFLLNYRVLNKCSVPGLILILAVKVKQKLKNKTCLNYLHELKRGGAIEIAFFAGRNFFLMLNSFFTFYACSIICIFYFPFSWSFLTGVSLFVLPVKAPYDSLLLCP